MTSSKACKTAKKQKYTDFSEFSQLGPALRTHVFLFQASLACEITVKQVSSCLLLICGQESEGQKSVKMMKISLFDSLLLLKKFYVSKMVD